MNYTEEIIKLLDVECTIVNNNEIEIKNAFEKYEEGYTNLIIFPSEQMYESLELKQDPKEIIQKSLKINATDVIEKMKNELLEISPLFFENQEDYGDFEMPEIPWEYSNSEGGKVIIAKIKTSHPWEVAAYAPVYGYQCPEPDEMVAIFKYWYELYNAIPISVTYNTWKLKVETKDYDALKVASEQIAIALELSNAGITMLSKMLKASKTWSLYWD